MKGIQYRIKISGLKSPEGTIPMSALKDISEAFLEGSERALRLSLEGISVKKGKLPEWLRKSLNFTITGIEKGSTVLVVEAPTLKEAAPEQIERQDLWFSRPDPKDTAVSLLCMSVMDIESERLESERLDRGLLDALGSFEPIVREYASLLEVRASRRPKEHFQIGLEQMERVSKIKEKIPEPKAIILSGHFNMIEYIRRGFELTLEDGRKIRGSADASFVNEENMRSLWGKQVTLRGVAHFKPSGRVRFVEAQVIKAFEPGEEAFEVPLEFESPKDFMEGMKRKYGVKSPLADIWGKWPGDESIEQLLSVLRETSEEGS